MTALPTRPTPRSNRKTPISADTTLPTASEKKAKAEKAKREPKTNVIDYNTLPKGKAPIPAMPAGNIDQQFLAMLAEDFQGDELKEVARTWLIAESEIASFTAAEAQAERAELAHIEAQIAKVAAQMEACLLTRGRVETLALRVATPERLLEYIDYYEDRLDELHPQLADEEHEEYGERQAEWHRLNKYLWECKQIAGLSPVAFQLVTGQSLDEALNDALAKHEGEKGEKAK